MIGPASKTRSSDREPSSLLVDAAVHGSEADRKWPLHLRVRFLLAVVVVSWAVIFVLIAL